MNEVAQCRRYDRLNSAGAGVQDELRSRPSHVCGTGLDRRLIANETESVAEGGHSRRRLCLVWQVRFGTYIRHRICRDLEDIQYMVFILGERTPSCPLRVINVPLTFRS